MRITPDSRPLEELERSASDGDVAAQLLLSRRLADDGRPKEAEPWLRRAAATGSVDARAALGRHLLEHQPHAAREGLSLVLGAASESADAAHLVAVFTAAGVGLTQSWGTALESLQRSAELGHASAQSELALLAGDRHEVHAARWGEAQDAGVWDRARHAIDPSTLFAVPPVEILSQSPRIGVARQFASAPICDWWVERARPRVEPAQIFDTQTGVLRLDEKRTNRETHFRLVDCDLITLLTRARLAAMIGVPLFGLELTAVLHYGPGQSYAPHVDYFDASLPGYGEEVATNGQRVATFLLYLNDDYEGGETEFPVLQTRFRGGKGDALFFWNVEPNGAIDPRTLHAGLPPVRGEKWLLSQWIRSKP